MPRRGRAPFLSQGLPCVGPIAFAIGNLSESETVGCQGGWPADITLDQEQTATDQNDQYDQFNPLFRGRAARPTRHA